MESVFDKKMSIGMERYKSCHGNSAKGSPVTNVIGMTGKGAWLSDLERHFHYFLICTHYFAANCTGHGHRDARFL